MLDITMLVNRIYFLCIIYNYNVIFLIYMYVNADALY